MKLSEIADIKLGLALDRKKSPKINANTYGYAMLTLSSFEQTIDIDNTTIDQFSASEILNDVYLAKVNDVIVRLRNPVKALYISKDANELLISSLMAKITIIYPNLLNARYLAYWLNSSVVKNQLAKQLQGSTITMTKVADLRSLEVVLPSLEQQLKLVKYLDMANQEIMLLQDMIKHKRQLKAHVFDKLCTHTY